MTKDNPSRVLVIEDDQDTRANLRDILELDDYQIEMAGSAAEALRRLDLGDYVAIILDRRLPDAATDDLLPELRRRVPEVDVIVVTGYSDLQGAIAALRQGAVDYILKPLNPDLLRATLQRVAQRQALTLARDRSEAMFNHLAHAADSMILVIRPDQTIAYFSPSAETLTGHSASEALGQNNFDLLLAPDQDRSPSIAAFERVLAGQPSNGTESVIVCRDGTRRSVVWRSRLIDSYDGVPAVLAVGQDITGLREAQERALQAERLAAIGQMVAGLAHESRNALQRSQACLDMLSRVVREAPQAVELVGRIQRAQDHLNHLFENVRGYAAPIRLELAACEIFATWRDAWSQLVGPRQGREVALVEELLTEAHVCELDRFRMTQVFRNLLDNALAESPDGTVIAVRLEDDVLRGAPALLVRVRDEGPGLSADARARLFEPFFTTKTRGTGLGMAISQRIVEAHGGRIFVGGSSGPGAEIVLQIPRGRP